MDRKQRILAIDDETDMLLLVASALKAEDFEVLTANNGKDGLELAKLEKPDAVILDVMMPEMNGFEVLEQLRLDPETQHLPVIMLTGISERSKIQSALDLGTGYYIIKPFEVSDLIGKVRVVLKEAAGEALLP
jgi:two-component system sensor histidine kinase/response regulator